MKKKVIVFSLTMAAAVFTLSSYKDGPAHGGLGNRSGSGGANSCSGSGCHRAESSQLDIAVTLKDLATNTVVTDGKYTPGNEYEVTLVGGFTGSTSYSHYGFQASVVNAGGGNIGTIASSVPNTAALNAGSVRVVEHTAPITGTGGTFSLQFKWTAPAAGGGTARIFARVVANNNNNTPGDDTPNSINVSYTEAGGTNIDKTTWQEQGLKLYPNPAKEQLHIELVNAAKQVVYNIVDVSGKVLQAETTLRTQATIVNIGSLPAGVYFVQFKDESGTKAVPFVKQ